MNLSAFTKLTLASWTIPLVLSACDGSSSELPHSPATTSDAMLSLAAINRHAAWRPMLQAAPWIGRVAHGTMLYISDTGTGDISAYTWPKLVLGGMLSGLVEPQGECVDAAGHVWVADTASKRLYEYAHWGGALLATLRDPGGYPVTCAVNISSGELAVGNIDNAGHPGGSIAVYAKAKGKPVIYRAPGFAHVYFVGYAPSGALFFDGLDRKQRFAFAKFVNRRFTPMAISGATINFPGQVQYADKSLTVADQLGSGGTSVVYQITATGRITGTTGLLQSTDCVDTYIEGNSIICPDVGTGTAFVYAYPDGGNPTAQISGFNQVEGAVISR